MIPQIQEVNFPSYATLHQATVSLTDMGDRVITTQVRIDGDVVPDFSGWELRFKGERFVLPSDNPQAMKDNTTRNSLVDLQFVSWPIQQLKRYFFFEAASVSAGVAIADKYIAPVRLNIADFMTLLNQVLDYYFEGKIVADLYMYNTDINYTAVKNIDINYTYLWDVIGQIFETYGARNRIEYNSTTDVYTIKFGYAAQTINHEFEYGYQGGLLKFERQVQDETIHNILLGRGGEKNLPYRYFKKVDPENPEWTADPDAIPELASIYFDRLRDVNFRWYVRGWMHNPNRDTSGDEAWDPGHVFPTYTIASDSPYYWAYQRGLTDEQFSPVEFVKDDPSIEAYGEHWGALDDNDDVFPTIQGRDLSDDNPDVGRIDEVVAVSPIETDDIDAAAATAAVEKSINSLLVSYPRTTNASIESELFEIPSGQTGNITYAWVGPVDGDARIHINTASSTLVAVDQTTGTEIPISGIPAGTYRLRLNLVLYIPSGMTASGTFGMENIKLTTSAEDANAWKPTFDIWVKNIWGTTKGVSESPEAYSARVWENILGDRAGNEAKVVFSTGFMSVSEDYEFVIVSYPVFDQTKTIHTTDSHGNPLTVQSEWRITLRKSDAEYDATGLYIPNNTTGGKPIAGDKFFFIGIDMPFMYVELAEEQLNTVKAASLEDESAVRPTWVISLDKVRVHTLESGEYVNTLADQLAAGAKLKITDPRFSGGDVLTLYAQSITYTWNEPSDGSPYLVPDIEVVLSDQVVSRQSRTDKIEASVEQIKSQYLRADDVESVVRRVAEPMFLKKTGESDSSDSPTQFSSKVTSKGFRQGGVGGKGWGLYLDNTDQYKATPATRSAIPVEEEDGDTVLEVDKVIVRKDLQINKLVVNQIEGRGGMEILSAAKNEITKVIYDSSTSRYICYFDQKQNSVANNFVVDDIAYGSEFAPDNTLVRYYKRKVEAVDVDRVELSDTVKDGSGVPQAGDVIVQYGNYTSADRQFVIVRDVIGGGYQRMLDGLNSVTAAGNEYQFSGRDRSENVGERWFVGKHSGEYAEWKNNQLNIKGRLTVLNSQGAYVAMTDYMAGVAQQFQEQQAQIDGQTQSWASGEATTAQTKPYPLWDEETQQIIGTPNYPYTQWEDDTERAKHVGDNYVDDTTGQSYRLTKKTSGGTTVYYWTRITDEEVSQALALAEGVQYLKAATNEGTLVDGGLVLTSMIQLGYTPQGGPYTVMSGINGKPNEQLQDPAKSIAAWFGGPMVDHETYPSVLDYAKSLFRMDGSGYLAGGNIGWQDDGDGHIPGISWETVGGVTNVTIGANVKLEQTGGTDSSVTDLVSAVQGFPSVYLSKTDAATLYHPKGGDTTSNTFNIGGATFTWHPAVGTTPGYLELNSAFLTLGDQIVGSGTPGGGGGGAGFLYELGDIYHDTNKTKVLRTDGTTPAAVGDVLQLTSLTGGNKWAAVPASSIGGVTSVVGQTGDVTAQQISTAIGLSGYLPLSGGLMTGAGAIVFPDADCTVLQGLGATAGGQGLMFYSRSGSQVNTTIGMAPDSGYTTSYLFLRTSSTVDLYHTKGGSNYKIWDASNLTPSDYVLKAGDTMTGDLTFAAGSSALNGKGITFGTYGHIGSTTNIVGVYSAGSIVIRPGNGSMSGSYGLELAYNGITFNGNTVYHAGNLTKSVLTGLLEGSDGYYVKKTGDTMSGGITFSNTTESGLFAPGSGSGHGWLYYSISGTNVTTTLGMSPSESDYATTYIRFRTKTYTDIIHLVGNASYKIWDAGNSNKSDVAWSCSNLDVYTRETGIRFQDTSSTLRPNLYLSASNNLVLGAGQTNKNDTYIYGNNVRIGVGSSGVQSTKFASDGAVGFGTDSPAYRVDVNGACAAKQFIIQHQTQSSARGAIYYYNQGISITDVVTPTSHGWATYICAYGASGESRIVLAASTGIFLDCNTDVRGHLNMIGNKMIYFYDTTSTPVELGYVGNISGYNHMYLRSSTSTGDVRIGANKANDIVVNASTHYVGIGTETPVAPLTTVGNIALYNASGGATPRLLFQRGALHEAGGYDWGMYSDAGNLYFTVSRSTSGWENAAYMTYQKLFYYEGTFQTAGDQVISSDINLKKNIEDLDLTVEQIAQLPAVTFDWKDGRGSTFGTVAQGVLPIFPQAVRGNEGNYSVVYGQGGWVFGVKNARAIVDIQAHETEQDKEIRELKDALGKANGRINELEDEVKRLRS